VNLAIVLASLDCWYLLLMAEIIMWKFMINAMKRLLCALRHSAGDQQKAYGCSLTRENVVVFMVHLGIWNCPYPSIEDFVRAPTVFSETTRTFAYFGGLALRFTSNTERTRKCLFIQLSRSCLIVWSFSYVWPFPPST
jgi:hypothetical protein